MVNDFFERHQSFAKICYLIAGLIFLYGTIRYGLLGLITGQTEIIHKFYSNTPVTSFWAYLVSILTLITGGFMTTVSFAPLIGEDFRQKILRNKLIQILFLTALVGYFLILLI